MKKLLLLIAALIVTAAYAAGCGSAGKTDGKQSDKAVESGSEIEQGIEFDDENWK